MTRPRSRVLIVARGHLGDLITALPALRDIRAGMPDAHITVLANEYVRGLLEGCPYVDDVLYGFRYPGEWGHRLRGAGRLLTSMVGRFDVVVGLRWSPRSLPLLALLARAHTRVGYDPGGSTRYLLTHNVGEEVLGPVSNRLLNLKVVQSLGLAGSPHYDRISWMPGRVALHADRLLGELGVPAGGSYAVVHMSSHWGCNEWHDAKWASLIDHIQDTYRLPVVATGRGERHEHDKFWRVAAACRSRRPHSAIGQTDIAGLVDLVSRARLMVACDTSVTQIALAQQTPAVVMFGIEEIEANGPLDAAEAARMRTLQHWAGPESDPAPTPSMCRFGESHCHWHHCTEDSSRRRISVAEVVREIAALNPLRRELVTATPS